MISAETIDQLKSLAIEEVISKYMKLDKSGANYKGKSPWSNEKTASFMVSPSKGIYKDFSSGKSGNNPIQFVMDFLNLEFKDAIVELAKKMNVSIQYDDSDNAQEYVKKQTQIDIITKSNLFAQEYFIENIENIGFSKLKKDLRYSKEICEKYNLGIALDNFNGLIDYAKKKGFSILSLVDAGLVNKKESKQFDTFINRVMFPIRDWYGNVIGFSGRAMNWIKEESKFPKYLNTKETKAFDKSTSFFGLFEAKNEIIKSKKFNLVEGQFDVISMHNAQDDKQNNPLLNTVAPLGTAFTDNHAKFLRKYADTCRVILDGDNAGIKAVSRIIPILVENDYFIEVCIMPEGQDPDSLGMKKLVEYINSNTSDGIHYYCEQIFKNSDTQIERIKSQGLVESFLATIPNHQVRNTYINWACKQYKISATEVNRNIKTILLLKSDDSDGDKRYKLPPGTNKEDWEKFGFAEIYIPGSKQTGYHFPSAGYEFNQQSNFIIKPLFHVYSDNGNENKRLVEIRNHKYTRVLEIQSRTMTSLSEFETAVANEGNFLFDGTKQHFQKIKHKLFEAFPMCFPIAILGWQKAGFYAFANGILSDRFIEVDQYGIAEFQDTKYYLPAFSSIHVNQDSDEYENERNFKFRKSNITFKEWNDIFMQVHGNNGIIGTAYFIASLFRDLLFKVGNKFPHLFLFGGTSRGKSFFARSLFDIFFEGQNAFNLNSGTQVGFMRRLGQVRNGIVWFDEYENGIDRQRVQQLKGAYDGTGYEKGVKESKTKTETNKIESASIISGQYLPTVDDGALFNRCLLLVFDISPEDRTEKQRKIGDKLVQIQKQGLSNIILEVIKYRDLVEESIIPTMRDIERKLKAEIEKENTNSEDASDIDGRLLENYSLILAPIKILLEKLNFSFSFKQAFDVVKEYVIYQSSQISESDSLATFFQTIEFLYENMQIHFGRDFDIKEKLSEKVKDAKGNEKEISFATPKALLYLRLQKIHPLYMEAHKRQHGENGHGKSSLMEYMKTHKAFIGTTKATRFKDVATSAYVFDYEMLNILLDEGITRGKSYDEKTSSTTNTKENEITNTSNTVPAQELFDSETAENPFD